MKVTSNKECLGNQAFFCVKKICGQITEFLSLRSFSRFKNSLHTFKAEYSHVSFAVIPLLYFLTRVVLLKLPFLFPPV